MTKIEKIVLSYSGGLDTSIIIKWLQETYGCEVVTFTADLGQGEELEPARTKAKMAGVKDIRIVDLREEFVRDFVFPMLRANALYEGQYLLGSSIARPLIAKHLVAIAREVGADAVAHGATGKGNDQVRFELAVNALDPSLKVIAPWRQWNIRSRMQLLEYAEKHHIPVPSDKRGEAPFSIDANLLHTSTEGKSLENPAEVAPDHVYQRTVAPDTPEIITIGFERGDPVSVNGKSMTPAALLTELNGLGGRHSVGRLDLVENRFIGMKSRGIYETPGGTILLAAHRGIESITLDRAAAHLKDEIMLQALIDQSQAFVSGEVTLRLYQGSASVISRTSPCSLYSADLVTFEESAIAYDHHDAEGFIRLNGLRLRSWAARNGR
ncbi:argininosuccinate synthase [Rhizobium ruizarguesonis]